MWVQKFGELPIPMVALRCSNLVLENPNLQICEFPGAMDRKKTDLGSRIVSRPTGFVWVKRRPTPEMQACCLATHSAASASIWPRQQMTHPQKCAHGTQGRKSFKNFL
jgi:hypothetical protein